ncbi:tetratricopeptide repeat protein [Actinacidiphila sp. ITFR-21]|uniref:tetratricopeptide repeat protein n=1 Tax=Actinacidiphila sp. ITFR-21 TaxID=3075199 RepID=UPI00288BA7BD|nr:tetratricopeptide repeat protein [Streptomyces sp. ITFR-21]WNI15935.1 tetratricopeptide repeat protein [Streptomyces sp. ITFR-21]
MPNRQQPSLQDLLRRRRTSGFVGRRAELAAFRTNLAIPPEDDAHRVIYHVHGAAGVGKSSLLRQWENTARELGALTGYLDEALTGVPDAMAALSHQFARQGRPFKAFDKLMASYRERRHEAEAVPEALDTPSPGGVLAAQAGLAGLGLVPGLGPVAGALDPDRLALQVDRLRAALSTRFGNEQDVRLVMSPADVLTPVFVGDLTAAAADTPWLALFLDTYERTGPLLDRWLRDLVLDGRYGPLPANLVLTLSGQGTLAPAVWGDFADVIADVPLDLFTEAEARDLLAAKGTTDERVVDTVLRLSGRLPVLVSTLAEARPAGPEAVDDPSDTAVERFLKWIEDPARRDAALAAALPRRLDEDVFREAVDPEAGLLYDWLHALPFVDDRAGRVTYHDVVRTAMLRLQRKRSPRRWRDQHERLAAAFADWSAPQAATSPWDDEQWAGYVLEETYHRLCADPRGALAGALARTVSACAAGPDAVRPWARMLTAAGNDLDAEIVWEWGQALGAALDEAERPVLRALNALLDRRQLDGEARAEAYVRRGREHARADSPAAALADYDAAVRIGCDSYEVHFWRGDALRRLDRLEESVKALDRALEVAPADCEARESRAHSNLLLLRHDDAARDADHLLARDPANVAALVIRCGSDLLLGDREKAVGGFRRFVSLTEKGPRRSLLALSVGLMLSVQGWHSDALAAYDVALESAADPRLSTVYSPRAKTLLKLERFDEALAAFDLALEKEPGADPAVLHTGRAMALVGLRRYEESLTDFDRALAVRPDDWRLLSARGGLQRMLGDYDAALADLDRAALLAPAEPGTARQRADIHVTRGHWAEAVTAYGELLDRAPDDLPGYEGRAVAYLQLGRPNEALADLDAWVRRAQDRAEALRRRAGVLGLLGRTAEAWADLDAALAVSPATVSLATDRAALHRRAGRHDRARTELARVADPAPGDLNVAAETLLVDAYDRAGLSDRASWRRFDTVLAAAPPAESAVNRAAWAGARALAGCALADWPAVDAALTGLLAAGPSWSILAELEQELAYLAGCPGADAPRLTARRDLVAAARATLEETGSVGA